MEINVSTKFKFGETIYFLNDNKVSKGVIDLITIHAREDRNPKICYSTDYGYRSIEESEAYASQEELFQAIQLKED